MPRPKPPRISAADAGWPSSSTNASRIAVAPSANARNRRSMPNAAPDLGAAIVAVVIEVALVERSGAHTELLLQIVPFGARGFNGAAGVAGPLHHRAGIEPGLLVAEQFVQHEPVGRRPVAGVAIGDRRACRQFAGDGREFRFRLQPVCRWIVELRAVDIERAGNVAIG